MFEKALTTFICQLVKKKSANLDTFNYVKDALIEIMHHFKANMHFKASVSKTPANISSEY